jgi:hypothetical protein
MFTRFYGDFPLGIILVDFYQLRYMDNSDVYTYINYIQYTVDKKQYTVSVNKQYTVEINITLW